MASKTEKRAKGELVRCPRQPKPSQPPQPSHSRIADYIHGKLSLDQMVNKDRIIKPEQRHNKRAFLPHINEEVKIVPRRIKPKTIEVKIQSRQTPPTRSKSKITEYDEATKTYRAPEPSTRKAFSFNLNKLNDCYFVITKDKSGQNAIEFKHEKSDDDSSLNSELPTPSSQSPCNDLIPVISNVNNNVPDASYYEETLVTKNGEISMLKERIRHLQKNIITKNNFGIDEDNVFNKILQSLDTVSAAMKILKNASDEQNTAEYVAKIEEEQDKWVSYISTISEGMKNLKELNNKLKNENTIKEAQLQEEKIENQRLEKELVNLKQENISLKNEKNDYSDMLTSVKHNLKVAQKENEILQQQTNDHKRLNDKAIDQLNMLNDACKKVQIELQDKERTSIELGESLRREIDQLEAANKELTMKYERVCEEVSLLQRNASLAEEVESRYQNEIQTAVAAKQQYIESLEKEAARLKEEIQSLEDNISTITRKNEQNYSLIAQLTNENHMLKEDTKYMSCEREQLNEAISKWCKNESLHDSVDLIEMIDELKLRMVIAENNYSNRLMENLQQTVEFTRILKDK